MNPVRDSLAIAVLALSVVASAQAREPNSARPEPTSVRPRPTPARPEPSSVRPRPTPARPEPSSARPEPSSVRPEVSKGQPSTEADRADIDRTSIVGNRELPKVLHIVPWKKPLPGELAGRPVSSVLDEALAPIDRDVFRRQIDYAAQAKARAQATPTASPR